MIELKDIDFTPERERGNLLWLTADIVAAHLSHNELTTDQLPTLIQSIHRALSTVDISETEPATAHTPAVPVKKSVFPDFIIGFEDGKKLKMLKRHLSASYGMTPNDYRTKWGPPRDCPMVAPSYAASWSGLAKQIGLGRKAAAETIQPESAQPDEPKITVVKARRARGSKG